MGNVFTIVKRLFKKVGNQAVVVNKSRIYNSYESVTLFPLDPLAA
jgi:hypothetical protein